MFVTFSGNSFFSRYHAGRFPVLHLSVRNHAERIPAFAIRQWSRGVLSRRTPVVIYFLSSPWKKESSKERRRRQIEIFLRSGVLGCSALPMLTSKEARNFIFTNGTSHARLRDASEHPSTCRSFRSRHRKISNRRASLHGAGRLNGNRKQRP